MSRREELHDAGRKAAKESFKRWIEPHAKKAGVSPGVVSFLLEVFEASYELILENNRNGGVITKGDLIRFSGKKVVGLAQLSEANRVACVASIAQLALTASKLPAAGLGAGWVFYVGVIALDLLEIGGNCYLYLQDAKVERQLAELEKQISARRMVGHSCAKESIESGQSLGPALEAMLDWRSRQPAEGPGSLSLEAVAQYPRLP